MITMMKMALSILIGLSVVINADMHGLNVYNKIYTNKVIIT